MTAMTATRKKLIEVAIPSCAKTRPFRNRPQISSLDAVGIGAESRLFRAAGLTSDPWGWRMNK